MEQQVPDLKVLYIETQPNFIVLQIADVGPGEWNVASVLGGFSAALIVVGIIGVAFIGYQLFTSQPSWIWFALFGVIVVFWALPKVIGPIARIPSGATSRSKKRRKTAEEKAREHASDLRTQSVRIEKQLDKIDGDQKAAWAQRERI